LHRLSDRRPSPALVIALIALFVSLGGVGYAAISVGTREIRNNAIRTQDVRNNELRGRDVRNSSLTGADVALNSITGADVRESTLDFGTALFDGRPVNEPTRFLGSPGGHPFGAGFRVATQSECAGCLAPGFWRDGIGVVHLQGAVQGPDTGVLFTLPEGYRPSGNVRFAVLSSSSGSDSTGVLTITPGGVVVLTNGDFDGVTSLDGVGFRAAGT
jgi:hypothetical protein